jgi:hypothetical protein
VGLDCFVACSFTNFVWHSLRAIYAVVAVLIKHNGLVTETNAFLSSPASTEPPAVSLHRPLDRLLTGLNHLSC